MASNPQYVDAEVHVWRVPLSLPAALNEWAESLLDAEEWARAWRFATAERRARFVAGRAIQRELLASYLRVAPRAVRYSVDARGKPELAGGDALRFNFSNSAELGLLAIATGRPVGIDIEKIRPVPDAMEIASAWFPDRDRKALESVSPTERDAMFLRCWTRNEACLKAGTGASEWKIEELEPAVEYVGAVTAEGQSWGVRCFDW